MKGCEKAHLTRPGYAIEYDFFDPRDLQYSLETKFIKGLFTARKLGLISDEQWQAFENKTAAIEAEKPGITPAAISLLLVHLKTKS